MMVYPRALRTHNILRLLGPKTILCKAPRVRLQGLECLGFGFRVQALGFGERLEWGSFHGSLGFGALVLGFGGFGLGHGSSEGGAAWNRVLESLRFAENVPKTNLLKLGPCLTPTSYTPECKFLQYVSEPPHRSLAGMCAFTQTFLWRHVEICW